jgi:NAD(P) transhydrogenase subunit alpha
VVVKHGVTLVGHTNFPSMVATDASALYARNVLDFMKLIVDKEGRLAFDRSDEIIAACLVCEGGRLTASPGPAAAAPATPMENAK